MKTTIYFKKEEFSLLLEDTFTALKRIKPKSVDMIFADPPYFLSNGGITVQSGKMVSVNKAEWDKGVKPEDKLKFNKK